MIRTHWIGAHPENSDLVNFGDPDGRKSGGNKRDKLKGTNARDSQFFADFRRFLQIFAFPGNNSISGAQTRMWKTTESRKLSGPNRAMQPRCAMRFESHTPKSLAMRKIFFR